MRRAQRLILASCDARRVGGTTGGLFGEQVSRVLTLPLVAITIAARRPRETLKTVVMALFTQTSIGPIVASIASAAASTASAFTIYRWSSGPMRCWMLPPDSIDMPVLLCTRLETSDWTAQRLQAAR